MKATATARIATAMLLLVFLGVESAFSQDAPPLGDDFIFFVEGTNVQVPAFDGTVVDDPLATDNKAIQYNYGDWSYQAFRQAPTADLTANLAEGDVFHMRLLVDPANQGKTGLSVLFEDFGDGNGVDDGTANIPFRLIWRIPEHYRDGAWHDLTIPLPPATWQELEDARTAETLDSLATYWQYAGGWSTGGFGVSQDGLGPTSGQRPDLWQEFEWNNVHGIGVFFDSNGGGGPVYLDDVYVGAADLDLSVATGAPAAMSGVTFTTDGPENVVMWEHSPDFGGYNVYSSEDPITDVSADGVSLLATVPFSADAFEVRQRLESPHPSISVSANYAVTSLSNFGVENPDVSGSSGAVDNPDIAVSAVILQLTEDEGNQLFDDLASGNASGAGFPEGTIPFVIDDQHSQLSESLTLPESNADNSASIWMGYTDLNELWIYAEVTDDVLEFTGEGTPGNDAWQFDSIEIGWGNYDVRDAGGSVLTGSPHSDMERGALADYQFRISAHTNSAGEVTTTHAFVGWSIDADVQGGGAAYGVLTDDAGNEVGYKMLALFPLDQIQNLDQGDAILPPPGADDIRLIPLTITLNDADGNAREHQITWSLKNNVSNQWWNSPNQWQTVAMVGRNQAIFTANEGEPTLPDAFSLSQNYPNPFNPATTIRFTLANLEAVTLRVYDVLGREVATLLDAQPVPGGTHSVSFDASRLASGVYFYRLEAGTAFAQTKQMLLLR